MRKGAAWRESVLGECHVFQRLGWSTWSRWVYTCRRPGPPAETDHSAGSPGLPLHTVEPLPDGPVAGTNPLRQGPSQPVIRRGMFPGASGVAAMWAFRAHFHALRSAVRAWNEFSLGSRQQVDDRSDGTNNQHDDQPDDRVLHSSVASVFVNPHQQRDIERDDADNDENQKTATSQAATRTRRRAGNLFTRLRHQERRSQ